MKQVARITAITAAFAAALWVTVSYGQASTAPITSTPTSTPTPTPPKRALSHSDFDAWKSLATPTFSRDGKWFAYSVQPQDGDGELVVREIATGKERREPVGALPPPVTTPDPENPDAPPPPRAIRVLFTADSRYLVATTYPTKAALVAARKAKAKAEDMPKGGALLIDLSKTDSRAVRFGSVKSIHAPSKGASYVGLLLEEQKDAPKAEAAKEATPKADELDEAEDQAARRAAQRPQGAAAAATGASERKTYGTRLILLDPSTAKERDFQHVTELSFTRDGKTLVYAVSSKDEAENGVYALSFDAGSSEPPKPIALLSGKGKYSKLTWNREQTQLAFFSDRDDAASKTPQTKAYLWKRGSASAEEVVINAASGARDGLAPSDKGALAFSRDGSKLYVPTAAPVKAPKSGDAIADEEKVVADLWRWNDDYVQPIQKVRAAQERNRTYRGVYDIANKRFTQLADETMRTVSLSDDGSRALALDDRPYRRLTDFDGGYSDVYLWDGKSTKPTLAVKKWRNLGGGANLANAWQWSPDGRWVLYYQDRHWQLLDTSTGRSTNLTGTVKRAFYNEEQDTPGPKGPYGSAGWVSDSGSVLIYDRFDVWQFFVDARAARNLTLDAGRKASTRLRVQTIEFVDEDDDERGINATKPLTLRGENETTRASGFFRTTFASATAPTRLLWGDANHRFVTRARDADAVVMTSSRFDRFPDYQLTNTSFSQPTAVTDLQAQTSRFLWGKAELLPFTSATGVPLQAAVYKPANFDARKKYPVIVYIYEKLSQNLHNFVDPRPTNGLNASYYTSNGYIVLMPDIVYGKKGFGKPGQDALDAVLPAIDKLAKGGFVDEKAIGIAGHSWGGYQIAWMVTRTNRFRAAESGAPVGNMTSAYSGIRWGSGLPRQFQYEQGQSRIAKPLSVDAKSYIEGSPIFNAHKVTTPLLILHNDADDAVPWYQGIELFLALRRHNKEAYLFNYNNQLHNLRRRADQKDFAQRMQGFFDHHLKGAAAPDWMTKGISFLEREEEKERFSSVTKASATSGAAQNAEK